MILLLYYYYYYYYYYYIIISNILVTELFYLSSDNTTFTMIGILRGFRPELSDMFYQLKNMSLYSIIFNNSVSLIKFYLPPVGIIGSGLVPDHR